ncbi:hypothetical protein Pcinc_017485 [Petrolisthes cinctipes]|uniref:Uncharacterized protein n=1 Tax=Petrolisthes cinctipes TaxID=88211 RepID=A0AAE1FP32_PETCI|nr:hypothetical protein Pcinc_017485 [Petrolisthes cinctipes]
MNQPPLDTPFSYPHPPTAPQGPPSYYYLKKRRGSAPSLPLHQQGWESEFNRQPLLPLLPQLPQSRRRKSVPFDVMKKDIRCTQVEGREWCCQQQQQQQGSSVGRVDNTTTTPSPPHRRRSSLPMNFFHHSGDSSV